MRSGRQYNEDDAGGRGIEKHERIYSDLPLAMKIITLLLLSPILAPLYVYVVEPLLRHLTKVD